MSAQAPLFYSDSIKARAAPNRYRQIGSPFAFLSSIGIDAILEEIYKGANIVDVARALNVSIGILLSWIDAGGYTQRIEDATTFSAEGHLSEAGRLLREARNDFDLKKAKQLADHGRFMATKLNKPKYGQDNSKLANATGVTFNMHIDGRQQTIHMVQTDSVVPIKAPPEIRALEGTFSIIPPTPDGVCEPEDIGPFEPAPFEPDAESIPTYLKDSV
jgi:hypothetical protein